jgi:hypothetical protein
MGDFLLSILFFSIAMILGIYLLLLGRRTLILTTAIICLSGTGSLLALIFLGESNAWALTDEPSWLLLGITAAVAIVGGVLGARAEHIASMVIGFFAGGYIGLWFYGIAFYVTVNIAQWPEQTAFWVGVAILIVGGLLGIFFTLRSEAVAVILISVAVGADLISRALNLSPSSNITAVITISLALLGLIVQYAQYLREIRAERPSLIAEVGAAPAPEYFDLDEDR